MTRRMTLFALALATLAAAPALAQPAPVTAQDVWARATPPGAPAGAVYLTLTSPADDKLTGASSSAAGQTGVHEMRMDGNVMRMREVEGGLALPAGQAVTLRPGGYHLMLERLKAPLKVGQTVPVRLTFERAPPLVVEAHVEPIGASGPGKAGQGAMPGMGKGK